MTDNLEDRLNQIPQRITSEGFLRGEGIGNEVAFYIFDYPAEAEVRVREYQAFLLTHLAKTNPSLRVRHVNLFELMLEMLEARGLLTRAFEMQKTKGDAALVKSLQPQFESRKLAEAFVAKVSPQDADLVLVSGVGSVFPLVRTHNLLAALQPIMGRTPLLMFYPGVYDGQYVRLFGQLQGPYYRAFKLIP